MKFSVVPAALLVATACRAPAPEAAATPDLRFDPDAIDRSVDPCTDFYAYACGGWRARHPIPPDRVKWSRYAELQAQNQARERALVEAASQAAGPSAAHIAAYHAACTDTTAIEARGLAPLTKIWAQLASLPPAPALAALDRGFGPIGLEVSAAPDRDDAHRVVLQVAPGALGLGSPDDYVRTGADAATLRDAYHAHVERVLRILAEPDPADAADRMIALEAQLARALPSAADRRAADQRPPPLALAALPAGFDWAGYFAALGAPGAALDRIAVPYPGWLAALAGADPPALRAYVRYHAARAMAAVLPHALDDEVFGFAEATLRGARQPAPRWQRCLALLDRDLGDDVGQAFVARYFPPQTRARVVQLVARVTAAFDAALAGNAWLSPAGRDAARRKLAAIRVDVGYPVHWKTYDFDVRPDDPVGNAMRARAAEMSRELAKLGRPADREEFFGLAQDLDGFGTKALVNVGFTAGFLQPPVFDPSAPDAINFGGFGGVIGHELTHHFDDEGRKYDAGGNLAPWWSDAEIAAYQARAQCFVDEYSRFALDDGTPVDGRLTLGENIADNAGLRLAWQALQPSFDRPDGGGDSPAQQFFLAWGQIRCENVTPEAARRQVQRDPHAPGRFRVNGVVANLPELARAFGCRTGAAMAPADRCRIW